MVDQFFAWNEKALERHDLDFDNWDLLPDMERVMNDPRWKAVLKSKPRLVLARLVFLFVEHSMNR